MLLDLLLELEVATEELEADGGADAEARSGDERREDDQRIQLVIRVGRQRRTLEHAHVEEALDVERLGNPCFLLLLLVQLIRVARRGDLLLQPGELDRLLPHVDRFLRGVDHGGLDLLLHAVGAGV